MFSIRLEMSRRYTEAERSDLEDFLAFPATQDLSTQQTERFRDVLSAFVAAFGSYFCLTKNVVAQHFFVHNFLRVTYFRG